MSFTQFTGIMGRLGIPACKCKHDTDAGLFIAYAGELRFTANSVSTKVTVRNMRTRATFLAEMGVTQAL